MQKYEGRRATQMCDKICKIWFLSPSVSKHYCFRTFRAHAPLYCFYAFSTHRLIDLFGSTQNNLQPVCAEHDPIISWKKEDGKTPCVKIRTAIYLLRAGRIHARHSNRPGSHDLSYKWIPRRNTNYTVPPHIFRAPTAAAHRLPTRPRGLAYDFICLSPRFPLTVTHGRRRRRKRKTTDEVIWIFGYEEKKGKNVDTCGPQSLSRSCWRTVKKRRTKHNVHNVWQLGRLK